MVTSNAWTIRPYQAGDERALVALFARVFGRRITEAHWRWKLATHTFAAPTVFLGVVPDANGERIIGQCAAIPTRFTGGAGDVTGMIAVDAMTDPDFRRQGLLTALQRHAYARWREAGAAFVIGLPNQQWGSRAGALGWHELFPLTWRIRPIRFDAMLARRFGRWARPLAAPVSGVWNWYWQRGTAEPRVVVRDLHSPAAFDELWTRLRDARDLTGCTIARDGRWIEWRYLSAPDQIYRVSTAECGGTMLGYCVSTLRLSGGRRIGYIAEFAVVNDDARVLHALIEHVTQQLAHQGAELVASLAQPGTIADGALRAAGFRFSWGSFSVQCVPLQSTAPPAFQDVVGGDFDVV